MTRKRNFPRLLALLCAGVLLTGCASARKIPAQPAASPTAAAAAQGTETPRRVSGFGLYFDTAVTVTLYEPEDGLLDDIWAACARYEQLLSKTVAGSDVDRINRAGGERVQVDPETWDILQRAGEISRVSGGAFSVSIAPLTALWDFTGGTERVPTEEERLEALPLVNDAAIVLGEDGTVTLPAGMSIDLGGIAKGYIADRIAAMCRTRCQGAVISLGGNTYVTGEKPDGSAYRVGVQDPQDGRGAAVAVLSLRDGSVVTSGIYERCFEKDGVWYHHILDPETGSSAMTDLASATVVTESSMTADAVATACIVLGSEDALRLLGELGLDGLLIGRDGTLWQTEGFGDKYGMVLTR